MKFVYGLIAIFALILVAVFFSVSTKGPGELDGFARCLETSGLKYYGAYWCPHCNDQKELFGNSKDKLPYIECSLPQKAGQTQACIAAGITSYPTWELPSGKRILGILSVQELSSLSGCPLNSTY